MKRIVVCTLSRCSSIYICIYIGQALGDWRLFSIVTSAPLAVTIVALWIVPESARWLVIRGRIDQTIGTLKECAETNGRQVAQSLYDEFRVIIRPSRMTSRNVLSVIVKPAIFVSIAGGSGASPSGGESARQQLARPVPHAHHAQTDGPHDCRLVGRTPLSILRQFR